MEGPLSGGPFVLRADDMTGPIAQAALSWTDQGAPHSRRFDDIYFSAADGLAESRAVFLRGCGLPEAWRGRRHFAVGELGFGTGLNILALLDLWRCERAPDQFPEAFLSDAVDGDGDGRRDIWGSSADALASAANLLGHYGWKRGGGWAREVLLPSGFDYSVTEGPMQTPVAWALDGVRAAGGPDWSEADSAAPAQLITPAGATGPAFMVFPNHFVIRRYNNSTSYALAVGLLADRIAGAPPLAAAWPMEPPMTSQDRIGAQQALLALGFNPGQPDGVIGINTRAAVRAWQKARGLAADGYLTVELSHRLQGEAAALPAAANAAQTPAATRN